MTAVPLKAAAAQLAVSVSTLRRMVAAGAPVARRGGRGRGKATLLDPAAVAAWRAAQGPTLGEARRAAAAELAAALPDLLADAVVESFQRAGGIDKHKLAGILSATWYTSSCAIIDKLRETDPGLAEISALPDSIERLRLIAAQ